MHRLLLIVVTWLLVLSEGTAALTRQGTLLQLSGTLTYTANGNQLTHSTTRTKSDGTLETLLTQSVYDDVDRLITSIAPDGSVTATVYNELGKSSVLKDPLGRETAMAYDSQGRLVRTTHPDGSFEETGYDAEGRRVTSTDRAGRVTAFVYDAVGRLIQTRLPDGTVTASSC